MAHFKENYFFWTKFCWAHGKTFLAFGYVFSSRIDEIFFYLSKKTIWGIFFLGKKYKMLTFSHTDWKNFGQLLNLFCEISKLYSTWTDVHFEPKRKLGKKFFYRFRILLEKNVWRDFQKDILLVQRNTFWIIAFFWKLELFSHFCRQRKKGSAFRQKFSRHDCHNCILHVYWNPLRKKLQFGKHLRLFTLFWQGATISDPAAKSSIMVAKIAFLVPIGTLWEKIFFWTKYICNFIMFVQWTKFFRVHGGIFLASGYIISAGLTELPSTCPEEQFEAIFVFLGGKNIFFNVFRHWLKKVRAFEKISRTGLSRLLSMCTEEHFGNRCTFWKTLFSFATSRTLSEEVSTLWQCIFGLLAIMFR